MIVLFVDDEEGIRDQAKIYLEKEDYISQVETIKTAEESLNAFEEKEIDVIVSDYKLPDMNGVDLLKKIREEDKEIPFIILTGKGDEDIAIKALNLGADKYFKKQHDTQELYSSLAKSIRELYEEKQRSEIFKDFPPEVYDLLKKMLSGEIRSIEPTIFDNEGSSTSYPETEEILGLSSEETVEVLESLVREDILERNFYDQFLVCPDCASSNIKISSSCPNCGSFKTQKKEIIEHLDCGYQGPTERFEGEDREYICPKCHEELQAIGVDYSKMSDIGTCEDCGEIFDSPDYLMRCDSCEEEYKLEDGDKKNIYSYELNEKKKMELRKKLKGNR